MPTAHRPPLTVLLLTLPLVVLTACASGDGRSGNGSTGGDRPAADGLQVEVDRGNGGPVEQYRLTCAGSVEGTLPDVDGACTHLSGLTDPFAPLPADAVCAQVYGGPQTARVTGRWHGSAVDLRLSRTDACGTVRWDRLGPLLPGPVG
ncbi:MAG: Protease inhibitor [Modestobacter sp.]|nr:Protease inhibitor [Modestobacter sp.]